MPIIIQIIPPHKKDIQTKFNLRNMKHSKIANNSH